MSKSNINKGAKTAKICSLVLCGCVLVLSLVLLIATTVKLGQLLAMMFGF